MRQLTLLLLLCSLLISPAWAQTNDADLYEVTDIDVDVTADSAAHARDQAIIQAQHLGFGQLVERLGAEQSLATKISDDDLATLVQNFEVQTERTSAVRYIATFTVQFRPNAVRSVLGSKGNAAALNLARSKPVVVLPVVATDGRRVLWEEPTKWRSAWETASHTGGLVPVTVPEGDLSDIALLSADEAVSGKASGLKELMEKYQAGGAIVPVLNLSSTAPADGTHIDLQRYDESGAAQPVIHLTLASPTDLAQGIKQIRTQLEKDWKQQSAKSAAKAAVTVVPDTASLEPTVTLPITVPLVSLTEWAQIRGRLNSIPAIRRTNVITLARGASSIEISFIGTVEDLRSAMTQQSLLLTQNMASGGGWVLRPIEPGDTL